MNKMEIMGAHLSEWIQETNTNLYVMARHLRRECIAWDPAFP